MHPFKYYIRHIRQTSNCTSNKGFLLFHLLTLSFVSFCRILDLYVASNFTGKWQHIRSIETTKYTFIRWKMAVTQKNTNTGKNMPMIDVQNNLGQTPLQLMIKSSKEESFWISFFLQVVSEISVNLADNEKDSPLHASLSSKQYLFAGSLIEKRANVLGVSNNILLLILAIISSWTHRFCQGRRHQHHW